MNDFLRFIDDLRRRFPVHLSISYNKTCDWTIEVYKKDCAKDYPDAPSWNGTDALLCYVQDIDMELCFAKAHVAVKEWMSEYHGGY